jgi:lysophospholipase L1-like esterase
MNVMVLFLVGASLLFIGYGLRSLYLIMRLPQNNPKKYMLRTSSPSAIQKQKLIVVGNSLTHGTLSAKYTDLLSERLNRDELFIDVINAGKNGDQAFHVLNRITDIIKCRPDFITILIGTNDAVNSMDVNAAPIFFQRRKHPHPSTLAFFNSNLHSLVTRLKSETNAKIALLSLPPIGEDLNHPVAKASISFSKAIQDISKQLKVEYLPLHEIMVEYLNNHPAQPKYEYKKRNLVFMKSLFKRILGYSSQKISKDLGFRLHIDFLHLNRTGASMIADIIEAFCKNHN